MSYDKAAKLYRGGWWLDPEGETYTDKAERVRTRKAWVKRAGSRFLELPWDLAILDESQEVRNPDPLISRWRSCAVATSNAAKVWLLSGTPVQNGPGDISGQLLAASSNCALIDPKEFGSYGSVDGRAVAMLLPRLIKITLVGRRFFHFVLFYSPVGILSNF